MIRVIDKITGTCQTFSDEMSYSAILRSFCNPVKTIHSCLLRKK